jgi:crotonobetainyl-CoA:carnitine CoA-transferase CaiB-like acyl-CoA transferase
VGAVRQLGALVKVDGRTPACGRPAPALGEHSAEVLEALRAGIV